MNKQNFTLFLILIFLLFLIPYFMVYIPTSDDMEEVNSISSEFILKYSPTKDNATKNEIVYYVSSGRFVILYDFYNILETNAQESICKIFNNIRLERKLKKVIFIKFYRRENIVQSPDNPSVQKRKKEEVLKSVILYGNT